MSVVAWSDAIGKSGTIVCFMVIPTRAVVSPFVGIGIPVRYHRPIRRYIGSSPCRISLDVFDDEPRAHGSVAGGMAGVRLNKMHPEMSPIGMWTCSPRIGPQTPQRTEQAAIIAIDRRNM